MQNKQLFFILVSREEQLGLLPQAPCLSCFEIAEFVWNGVNKKNPAL